MATDRNVPMPGEAEQARLRSTRGESPEDMSTHIILDEAETRWERMELSSESFDDGDLIPARHAHDRDNLSPPLTWSVVPPDTAELALVCQDPDAPTGTFTHWVLAGIDPVTTVLDEGEVPAGAASGTNDFGERGWGGPEPPVGDAAHRYVFTLFASGVPLSVDEGSVADDLFEALDGNELGRGQLIGYYQR